MATENTTGLRWPFGAGSTKTLTATGAQAITIDNNMTVIDGVTVSATGNRTINLTIGETIAIGAILIIKSKTDGTETTIPGTGMTGATTTGVAGKTKNILFIYDGTNFVQAAAAVQVD